MRADLLTRTVKNALTGKGAHTSTRAVFDGLEWTLAGARPEGAPHTAHQLLQHMTFWQEWVVRWLDGEDPATPSHAKGGWPGGAGPRTAREWHRAVQRYQRALDGLENRAGAEKTQEGPRAKSAAEMLQTIASHNSYHAGQVATLRQMLGAWPPPSGGLTW